MLNPDIRISQLVNSLAGHCYSMDRLANFLNGNLLIRGFFVFAVFYYLWFQDDESENSNKLSEHRQILLYTILICIPGLVLVRLIAWSLPFRDRPIQNPAMHLHVAYGFEYLNLLHWSSFPSDTTMLFFLLATGAFLINRPIGVFLWVHAFIVVGLTRIYLGIHYPSDVLGGMVLGILVGLTAAWPAWRSLVNRPVMLLRHQPQGLFYACLFILSCETASEYVHVRTVAEGALQVLRHFVSHGAS